MCSFVRVTACSALISSTTAATKQWEARGVILILPRWAGRRPGKIRRKATRRLLRINGGTGTTTTMPSRRLTPNGSTSLPIQLELQFEGKRKKRKRTHRKGKHKRHHHAD